VASAERGAILASYSFEDEAVATGPDTFAIWQRVKGKSFEVLVQFRWAMKNALAAPPVWLAGFPRFSSPC
jgi:hypothetical protein